MFNPFSGIFISVLQYIWSCVLIWNVRFQEFVGANDALAEAVVSLLPMYKEALLRKGRASKEERMVRLGEQWVTLFHPNVQGELVSRQSPSQLYRFYLRGRSLIG